MRKHALSREHVGEDNFTEAEEAPKEAQCLEINGVSDDGRSPKLGAAEKLTPGDTTTRNLKGARGKKNTQAQVQERRTM